MRASSSAWRVTASRTRPGLGSARGWGAGAVGAATAAAGSASGIAGAVGGSSAGDGCGGGSGAADGSGAGVGDGSAALSGSCCQERRGRRACAFSCSSMASSLRYREASTLAVVRCCFCSVHFWRSCCFSRSTRCSSARFSRSSVSSFVGDLRVPKDEERSSVLEAATEGFDASKLCGLFSAFDGRWGELVSVPRGARRGEARGGGTDDRVTPVI